MKTFKLKSGACACYFQARGLEAKSTMFIVHGWTSNIFKEGGVYLAIKDLLVEASVNCLLVSLRGHDGTDCDIDHVTRKEHIEDVRAGFEWLKEKRLEKISAFGASYGGFILALLASELPIENLILRAPTMHPDNCENLSVSKVRNVENLRNWKILITEKSRTKALQSIRLFDGRLHIITSGEDEVVPLNIPQSYFYAHQKQGAITSNFVVPRAKHSLGPEEREVFLDHLRDFVSKM